MCPVYVGTRLHDHEWVAEGGVFVPCAPPFYRRPPETCLDANFNHTTPAIPRLDIRPQLAPIATSIQTHYLLPQHTH